MIELWKVMINPIALERLLVDKAFDCEKSNVQIPTEVGQAARPMRTGQRS